MRPYEKFDKQNFFLIYGENEGQKDEIIQILKNSFKGQTENSDESQIINNKELFYETIFNQSLFEKEKIEYTLRTIRSLLNSVKANPQLKKIKINFKVIDHNSSQENLEKIDIIFKNFEANYNLINLRQKFNNYLRTTMANPECTTFGRNPP